MNFEQVNLQSTFGHQRSNIDSNSQIEPNETRIKVHTSFQDSYLQGKRSFVSDKSNNFFYTEKDHIREKSQEKESRQSQEEQQISTLRRKIKEEEMWFEMEKKLHEHLLKLRAENRNKDSSKKKQKKESRISAEKTIQMAAEYLESTDAYVHSLRKSCSYLCD